MKFTTLPLLLFVAVFAISFALVKQPSQVAADVLNTVHVISGCTALVVAFHTQGRVQSYALTYGVFSLGMLFFRAFPSSISIWIWMYVTHDGPDTAPIGNGDQYLVDGIVQTTFGILVGLFAASFVVSVRE